MQLMSDKVMVRTGGGSSHFWTRKCGTSLRVHTFSIAARELVAQGLVVLSMYQCGEAIIPLFNQTPA